VVTTRAFGVILFANRRRPRAELLLEAQMYRQVYDPVAGSLAWSALFAALPLVTLFVLLGGLR
jgi:hypothetical protein